MTMHSLTDRQEMNIWQIATGEAGRDFSSLFFEYDIMILGPSLELGDALVDPDKYWDGVPNSKNNQVWSFANKPKPGDRVLMRYNKEVIAIGQIPLEPEHQYSFQHQFKCVYGWDLCHTRRVIWTNNNIPGNIKSAFADRKQQPSFTEVYIPVMWTHRSCDEDPPFERAVIVRAFIKIKDTL